ncbi:glutamate--cysteine ligase [Parvularcula bermudensis HTCC2503]|uniref:Glutamate--cysteine ligase n=1 Tax=Parvularcula bermudensis (strain ATCC BAA-594 / HTCC2503 / KCTC 12087) TaxID=314260 RepID=E0TIG1_PARBH|nr:glutamate--cysteine ligase [Parvularcula bermudensis]ADM10280.1 glutamate--cysteine ligase [Parvularcula bermudensis HTCC2503]
MTQLDASAREDLPPIEDVAALSAYLASGCKPVAEWRIGTEHEKFGFLTDSYAPLPFSGERSIEAVLHRLSAQYGWTPLHEGDALVALKKEGASITLEPGGQFELSGAPLVSLHETCNEVHTHLAEVKAVAEPLGIGFIGLGAAPSWSRDDMPKVPKGRYTIMRNYMPKVGSLGLDMMHRTATVQVNLDFASEADMVMKFRTALALQPLATALFANSPFIDAAFSGYRSFRAHIWTDTDPDRTGMLDFVFEDGFGFERYTEYMLDVPMYFLWRDGDYVDVAGQSFRDLLAGELPGAPGQLPTLEDWKDHLSTAFPEVRLKTFLEMRGADSGSWGRICALPAFWVGLLYDDQSLNAAWDLVRHWSQETRAAFRHDAAKEAMAATVDGRPVTDLAREVLALSAAGLQRRACRGSSGRDERTFLDPLVEIAETGKSFACTLLHDVDAAGGDFTALFDKYAF